jgi:hypothetical protein
MRYICRGEKLDGQIIYLCRDGSGGYCVQDRTPIVFDSYSEACENLKKARRLCTYAFWYVRQYW